MSALSITASLVLPADVVLQPALDLPAQLREQIDCAEHDFAITRHRSRTPSKIIDAETAALLRAFETPHTIVEAIIDFSSAHASDPETTLVEAFPMLQRFMQAGWLVEAGSPEAERVEQSFQAGDQIGDWEARACVHVLQETELYEVVGVDGQHAALKLLRPAAGALAERMFAREAAILTLLDGERAPALLDSGVLAGRRFVAMAWRSGVTAEVAAERCRALPPEQRLVALRRLCGAVLDAYIQLHARGVIHGDVHPGNILVDEHGAVTLIDFGMARNADLAQRDGEPPRGGISFFYDPEYARALREQRYPPPAAVTGEQYSLAALLYLLLTGAHYLPFAIEQPELLRQIVEDPAVPFTTHGLPAWPALEAALARALSKDPAARFPTVADFARAVQQAEPPAQLADADQAVTLLDEVLARLHPDAPLFATPLAAPTSSVNYGAAGIAYALLRIACVRDDATLLAQADLWATRAAREAACDADGAFYSRAMDLTPETVGSISLFHTASGLRYVQVLLARARGDLAGQQAAIGAFIADSRQPCANFDLTLGRGSTLLGCVLLLDDLPDHASPAARALLELGDETARALWAETAADAPIGACPRIKYLGLAHGWAGLLYTQLLWSQTRGAPLPGGLKTRLDGLAACAVPAGRGARWPWLVDEAGTPDQRYFMPGWCNGSAGYVYLWTLAHSLLGEDAYLRCAAQAAWNAWEEPDAVGTLCCGAAGRAYALLNLWRHTGDVGWLTRAQELATRAAVTIRAPHPRVKPAERPRDSLYKGELGVALLLAELAEPADARMPLCERNI